MRYSTELERYCETQVPPGVGRYVAEGVYAALMDASVIPAWVPSFIRNWMVIRATKAMVRGGVRSTLRKTLMNKI